MLRSAVRTAIEAILTGSGLPGLARRRRDGTIVLAYHNVTPSGTPPFGDRSLHLDSDKFLRQLVRLRETHDVISLDELAHPAPSARPRAAITFDDAYAGALEHGLPIIRELGLSCTVFVAPGLLGREAMWWDLLADPERGLSDAIRCHALRTLAGRHEEIMAWAASEGHAIASPSPWMRIGTMAELFTAAQLPGVTIGLHTWSHPNLSALEERDVRDELISSLTWLKARYGCLRPWLAYPYGLFSPSVSQVAAAVQLEHAFRIDGGWTGLKSPAFALPRLNVPAGLSARGWELRSSGVF